MRFDGLDSWPEAVPLQAPDFEPRVVGDLEHWLWQDRGEGQGRVYFSFGDLVLEFRAEAVEIG